STPATPATTTSLNSRMFGMTERHVARFPPLSIYDSGPPGARPFPRGTAPALGRLRCQIRAQLRREQPAASGRHPLRPLGPRVDGGRSAPPNRSETMIVEHS